MSSLRTIRVTGEGTIFVKPDLTRITMSLEETHLDYGEALLNSSKKTARLRDLLVSLGFDRSDLKTQEFSLDTKYKESLKGDDYKRRFVGYNIQHKMKVDLEPDNERLGKILYALGNSSIKTEVDVHYIVRDLENVKKRVLEKAVADAREKADVLTQALGVTLSGVRNIDFSYSRFRFETQSLDLEVLEVSKSATDSYFIDIEPNDIKVSDTVTVLWEIE